MTSFRDLTFGIFDQPPYGFPTPTHVFWKWFQLSIQFPTSNKLPSVKQQAERLHFKTRFSYKILNKQLKNGE